MQLTIDDRRKGWTMPERFLLVSSTGLLLPQTLLTVPSVTTKLHGKKEKVVSDNDLPARLLHLD